MQFILNEYKSTVQLICSNACKFNSSRNVSADANFANLKCQSLFKVGL